MNDVWKGRERSTSHIAERLIYSVIERDTGSNPVRRTIFFRSVALISHWILEKKILLVSRGTLSSSQRRRGLSTMLIPNMQLVFSGNSSFKIAPGWYDFVCEKSFLEKRFCCLRMSEWTWCLQGQWEHFLWKSISSVVGRNQGSGWAGRSPAQPSPWAKFFWKTWAGLGWADVIFRWSARGRPWVPMGWIGNDKLHGKFAQLDQNYN